MPIARLYMYFKALLGVVTLQRSINTIEWKIFTGATFRGDASQPLRRKLCVFKCSVCTLTRLSYYIALLYIQIMHVHIHARIILVDALPGGNISRLVFIGKTFLYNISREAMVWQD